MAENDFELDIAPKKVKAAPQVSSWMLVLGIITFLGLATVLTLQAIEYRYMRGQMPSENDPYSAEVILPDQG